MSFRRGLPANPPHKLADSSPRCGARSSHMSGFSARNLHLINYLINQDRTSCPVFYPKVGINASKWGGMAFRGGLVTRQIRFPPNFASPSDNPPYFTLP